MLEEFYFMFFWKEIISLIWEALKQEASNQNDGNIIFMFNGNSGSIFEVREFGEFDINYSFE